MAKTIARAPVKAPRRKWSLLKKVKFAFALLFVALVCGVGVGAIYLNKRLEEAATLIPSLPEKMKMVSSEPSVILASDGSVMERIATDFRKPVNIQDVPPVVIHATLAAEDKRFYQHDGIDYWGMGRALVTTASGRRVEGGSTIPMQLAKRLYSNSARSLDRKVQDMALAVMIERKLTKDQILELYLNQIFYGSGAYGIAAAAEVYFGKKLSKLSAAEAATLSRCVRRPTHENPYADPKVAIRNRNIVLKTMLEEGWLKQAEYDKAVSEPLILRKSKPVINQHRIAPYFCDYVKAWIRENAPDVDLTKGGYKVETTLDLSLQEYTEKRVQEMVRRNRRLRITTAAFLLTDREGRILAMVGGPDYERNQFNVVTQGKRQPGSSFKPIVYGTAFEYGALSPNGSVRNDPFMIRDDRGRRRPIKGGGKGGSVSVRSAIAVSNNTAAMWAQDKVGVANVVHMAHTAFGIQSELPAVDTLALGAGELSPIEMAGAYSVFANHGTRYTPFGVRAIIGPEGLPEKRVEPEASPRQLSAEAADGVDTCLRAVVTGGTGRAAGSVTNARGKTGTTSSNKDAWFCGYTDKFIGIGWVANEVRLPDGRIRYERMNDYVMGGHMVAPLWAKIVGKAQDLMGETARSMRSGHVEAQPDESQLDEEPTEEPGTDPDAGPAEPFPDEVPPIDDGGTTPPDATGEDGQSPPTKNGRPAEDPPKRENRTEPNVVFVEICADSGQRATIYCPETVRRAYRAGSEPRGRCAAHRP